jgi:small subunit ribosomal protein S7
MPRRREIAKREVLPDPKYVSQDVAKFVNVVMTRGKKSVAERMVYGAFEQIAKKGNKDPLEVFSTALSNIRPMVEVKSRRVGGANYQVPVEVRSVRRTALAMRWQAAIVGMAPPLLRELAGRLQTLEAATDETKAQARGVTLKRVARSVKGDLDTIILKALSKQPSQRYASADAFAQDIERYLTGEAVLAQPKSAWYRARKFVLRNKLVVGAAMAVVAALSVGLGIALREAHIAQIQTRTAETVRTFLLDIFRANSNEHDDPVKARQTTARELLDLGAGRRRDHVRHA